MDSPVYSFSQNDLSQLQPERITITDNRQTCAEAAIIHKEAEMEKRRMDMKKICSDN